MKLANILHEHWPEMLLWHGDLKLKEALGEWRAAGVDGFLRGERCAPPAPCVPVPRTALRLNRRTVRLWERQCCSAHPMLASVLIRVPVRFDLGERPCASVLIWGSVRVRPF